MALSNGIMGYYKDKKPKKPNGMKSAGISEAKHLSKYVAFFHKVCDTIC